LSSTQLTAVGVFGGTFDPIHYGHLRSALELCERLHLSQLRLMPCAVPAHRASPQCSAQQRAAMVELAVRGESRLICDARELQRSGPSYTIDSLMELREELGESVSLSLVMGCDAVLGINSWHRWEEILDWAHVLVIARPGWDLPERGEVSQWLAQNRLDEPQGLVEKVSGSVYIEQLRPLDISSTEIRKLLANRQSARYLMPEPVLDYIEEHGLYETKKKEST
jgi:nicotinate-nucleotide adenylyltransferase